MGAVYSVVVALLLLVAGWFHYPYRHFGLYIHNGWPVVKVGVEADTLVAVAYSAALWLSTSHFSSIQYTVGLVWVTSFASVPLPA